nr:MAG TPA: resuscitation-promoting factor [Caudoviricetes sp.]
MTETPYVDYTPFNKKLTESTKEIPLDNSIPLGGIGVGIGEKLLGIDNPVKETGKNIDMKGEKLEVSTPKDLKGKFTSVQPSTSSQSGPSPIKDEIVKYITDLTSIDDNFKRYLIKLAERESSFNPSVINKYGYKGLFQMGDAALQDAGMTTSEYMSDWKNQIQAIINYTNKNRDRLSTIISANKDRDWGGVKINEYGILGAAHLGGAKGVTELLLRGKDKSDAYGTPISGYLKFFSV